ncbi:MAG TPA: DHA2 family efflux MFS transporter permease subunit [Gammaproteobacteria bacterium]|jgi:EmrB/QacA subfamily drug resistance transporter|nr:DHA2 family efflux MFS transporter permease subunit [Gammaproteobacteria bacterium]
MKYYIPFAIAFAMFMETLDSTILGTAIPRIALSLQVSPISLKIALTSYLLSLAIFIPISGWFADRFGTKKVFITALLVFTLGSLCCALANTLVLLVLARILQGFGGAMMMPVGRLILLKSFPKSELVRATNFVTIPALLGPALGPVLGGIIVSYVSWRWIFFVNIPFGLLGSWFAYRVLSNHVAEHVNPLDFTGFVLVGSALAGFAFSLGLLSEGAAEFGLVAKVFAASCGLLFIYFIRARYISFPFINMSLFKVSTFRITLIASFLSRCGIGGMPFLLPLFFQLSLGKSALHSGLLLAPYALGMMLMKSMVRLGLKAFGFKRILLVNTVLLGVAMAMFALVSDATSVVLILALVFASGLLTSLQFSCMNVLTFSDLPHHLLSQGTSLASANQQLSMSFGIALAAISLKYFLGEHGNPFEIQLHVFHQTFLILGLMTGLSAMIFTLLDVDDGVEISGHESRAIFNLKK